MPQLTRNTKPAGKLPTVPGLALPTSPEKYFLALSEAVKRGDLPPLDDDQQQALWQLLFTCEASEPDPQPTEA